LLLYHPNKALLMLHQKLLRELNLKKLSKLQRKLIMNSRPLRMEWQSPKPNANL